MKLLPYIETESKPNPQAAVIWLHGLGASGDDFAGIVPALHLQDLPAIRFIFPHAPSMPVSINGGYVMPAWYDIRQVDLAREEDEEGIRKSALQIENLIDEQVNKGIATNSIVLAGFSQGCAMVLHTGLRFKNKLAGIIGLSGYLPLQSKVNAERNTANQDTPIFMAHGTLDPVVPFARAQESAQMLQQMGYGVHWRSYAMAHAVHPDEVAEISAFLRKVLL